MTTKLQLPLGITATHRFEGLDMAEETFQRILRIASWAETPTFYKRGRMAMHTLEEPVSPLKDASIRLRAVKMKGVGAYNPPSPSSRFRDQLLDEYSDAPIPPTTVPLTSFVTYPHFGIDSSGEYMFAYGSLAPVGGILHDRALLEFRNASILLEHGVPCIVPLAVVRYDDRLRFNDKPMGAALSLMPEPTTLRVSEIQFGSALHYGSNPAGDRYYDRMRAALEIEGDPAAEETRLRTLCAVIRKIGKISHDFTMAGLFRYSPELTNYEFDFDRALPVLTDLDSTLELSTLPPKLQTLQALRDLASVTYRVMAKFYTPSALGHYSFDLLQEHDPLCALLQGYFPGLPESAVRGLTSTFWSACAPYFFLLNKHREKINHEWDGERRRSYKMDHDLFYILAMSRLFPLFQESDVFVRYPSDLREDALDGMAERFLGERYAYFRNLLTA